MKVPPLILQNLPPTPRTKLHRRHTLYPIKQYYLI